MNSHSQWLESCIEWARETLASSMVFTQHLNSSCPSTWLWSWYHLHVSGHQHLSSSWCRTSECSDLSGHSPGRLSDCTMSSQHHSLLTFWCVVWGAKTSSARQGMDWTTLWSLPIPEYFWSWKACPSLCHSFAVSRQRHLRAPQASSVSGLVSSQSQADRSFPSRLPLLLAHADRNRSTLCRVGTFHLS